MFPTRLGQGSSCTTFIAPNPISPEAPPCSCFHQTFHG
jgi:hypothetical protein